MSIKHLLFLLCAVTLPLTASLPCDPCTYPSLNDTITDVTNPNLLAFSSQRCLAVGDSTANTVTLYGLDESCRVISTSVPLTSAQGINAPVGLAFSPNGSCLIVANAGTGPDGTVTVYQVGEDCQILNDGDPTTTLPFPGVNTLAVSLLGCVVITTISGSSGFTISGTINNDCTLTLGAPVELFFNPIVTAFSADGACLAVILVTDPDNRSIVFFAVDTNCELDASPGSSFPPSVTAMAYSPNNCFAFIYDAGNSVGLRFPTGISCGVFSLPEVTITNGIAGATTVAYSNNSCLAVTNAATVTIYSIAPDCTVNNNGAPIRTISVSAPLAAAFSPDNACLAVSSGDGNVLLYSATLLTPVISAVIADCTSTTVIGTANASVNVTIFADGVLLASGTSDADGTFSITTGPLTTGTIITAQAQDPVTMCLSTISNPVAVVVMGIVPVIDRVFSTCLGAGVIGTATPGATVTVLVNGAPVATGVANAEGGFVVPSIALVSGTYCFAVTDASTGCTSTPVCTSITITSCILAGPNLAFGTHCNV